MLLKRTPADYWFGIERTPYTNVWAFIGFVNTKFRRLPLAAPVDDNQCRSPEKLAT